MLKIIRNLCFGVLLSLNIVMALKVDTQAVSNDKKILALAYDDNVIRLYSLENGKLLSELKAHTKSIQTLSFSHDNTQLLSGSWDDFVIVWDLNKEEIITKKDMGSTVMHAYFTFNDKNIVLSVDEKGLMLFDKRLTKELKKFKVDYNLQISKNHKFIVGRDSYTTVALIDLVEGKRLMHLLLDAYDDDMYFSDDEKISIIRDYDRFHIWDTVKKESINVIRSTLDVECLSLNSLANELWIANNNKIEIWDYLKA